MIQQVGRIKEVIHLHITGWVVAFILLFITVPMYKSGNRSGKITHMILRLFYLIILFSGIMLFMQSPNKGGELFIKVIAGLWAIVAMEMVAVRTNQNRPTASAWAQFIITVIIAIILGFGRLPLGVQLF